MHQKQLRSIVRARTVRGAVTYWRVCSGACAPIGRELSSHATLLRNFSLAANHVEGDDFRHARVGGHPVLENVDRPAPVKLDSRFRGNDKALWNAAGCLLTTVLTIFVLVCGSAHADQYRSQARSPQAAKPLQTTQD